MKLIIHTNDPFGLKEKIVSDVENGNLSTWELRTNIKDDKLLTHSGDQWVDKVLLRLTPDEDKHIINVETRHWSNVPQPTKEEYGTVLGRFCERLFVQYSTIIDSFEGFVSE